MADLDEKKAETSNPKAEFPFKSWLKDTLIGGFGAGAILATWYGMRMFDELSMSGVVFFYIAFCFAVTLVVAPITAFKHGFMARNPEGDARYAFLSFVGSLKGAAICAAVITGVFLLTLLLSSEVSSDWGMMLILPFFLTLVTFLVGKLYLRIFYPNGPVKKG